MSAYDCERLEYTIQHRTALKIFPLILQTIIIAHALATGGEGDVKSVSNSRHSQRNVSIP